MLPSLERLRTTSIGAKTDESDKRGAEAQQLLQILSTLPSLEETKSPSGLEPDWVYALSDTQFDMLLSLRLYTGSMYRLMAPALDPSHMKTVQSNVPLTLSTLQKMRNSLDKSPVLVYVALVNARRRLESGPSPLFLEELNEDTHVNMEERDFRAMVASLLTKFNRPIAEGRTLPPQMLDRFEARVQVDSRISRVRGPYAAEDAAQLRGTSWAEKTQGEIVDASLRELWAAVRHSALALKALIAESHVLVGSQPVPVYRGMREVLNLVQINNSFVSVSLNEKVARGFTTNRDLSYRDPEIGAPDQCCMMRVSLLEGTPYLNVDATMKNSNGWGFSLGEAELILPPGLDWQVGEKEHREQPATFSEEIYAHVTGGNGTLSYNVKYYIVAPPSPTSS